MRFGLHLPNSGVITAQADLVAMAVEAEAIGFDTSEMRDDSLRSLMLMVIGDSDSEDRLLDIMNENRIGKIPEHFALMVRTLVLLNGLSHRLAPRRRLIQGELIQHLAAGASLRPPRHPGG